jgi:Arc/MetJ family transcription regulator
MTKESSACEHIPASEAVRRRVEVACSVHRRAPRHESGISSRLPIGYTAAVTKRLIDVDDQLLDKAQTALGTRTMKDTVNQALAEVTKAQARRRHAERLARMDGLDLADAKTMAGAWRH